MDAARAASAQPSVRTRTKCSGCPAAAAGDDRDVRGARHRRVSCAIEAVLHAIGIHRRQQNFARAERLSTSGPLDRIDPFIVAAAARVNVPAAGPTDAVRRSPAPPLARRIRAKFA